MDLADAETRMAGIRALSGAYMESAILIAANRLEIFAALSGKPATAAGIARALGAPERGVRMLLDALAAMGLLGKSDGLYRNAEEAEEFLVPGRPLYMGDSLRHALGLYERFGRLADAVKSGEPAGRKKGKRSPEEQRAFILSMANIGALSARRLLPLLALEGTERVLDLGGGPGTYLQVFCENHPGLRGVLFDLPETAAIAREYLDGRPGSERIEIREGDFLAGDLGEGFDACLVSNIIHSLGPGDVRSVFGKVRRCLAPGGRVFVKDFLLDGTRTAPRHGAVFALNMFLATREGDCYTFEEVEAWLAEAGFAGMRRRAITESSSFVEARAGA